jgi:hypothetical protein
LDVTTTMGRLSAAGISFNTQPSPAVVAAALDLAAQVTAALSPYQYEFIRREKDLLEQQQQQQQQQDAQPSLPLLPLYLTPLQQQQQQASEPSLVHLRRLGEVDPQGNIPLQAYKAIKQREQFWALGAPLICFHGSQLLQRWEQQLLQQIQQEGAAPSHVAAPPGCDGGSSSSSRPAWQEAEACCCLGLQPWRDLQPVVPATSSSCSST